MNGLRGALRSVQQLQRAVQLASTGFLPCFDLMMAQSDYSTPKLSKTVCTAADREWLSLGNAYACKFPAIDCIRNQLVCTNAQATATESIETSQGEHVLVSERGESLRHRNSDTIAD